ncbi:WXG100 family type VII secretion target [Streptoalloteichus hindustanus]|uniref:WXG100 family type VII secretion target n=1 Tax=Streptoalloteichus hindustanus TaxID=2017 RepID=UPI001F360E68|nr:WXG100 family type VII secretion target [Streptoalloteichus hindustanus]
MAPAPLPYPPRGASRPGAHGPDGDRVADGLLGHLDYLSRLARDLGVPDPVEEYFGRVVGRWNDMHEQAEAWRAASRVLERVRQDVDKPLGALDAVWDGADSDSFLDHMRQVGQASTDLGDAMTAMAEALDVTAEAIRGLVRDMAAVLADGADSLSQALTVPLHGEARARAHLDDMKRPTREIFESVREVLEAFVRLCDGIDAGQGFGKVAMPHTFPDRNWTFDVPKPKEGPPADTKPTQTPKEQSPGLGAAGGGVAGGGVGAGAVGGAVTGGALGGGTGAGAGAQTQQQQPLVPGAHTAAVETPKEQPKSGFAGAPAAAAGRPSPAGSPMAGGMMPMGGMMGGGQGQGGGETERRNKSRLTSDPSELFGEPRKAAPPVIE